MALALGCHIDVSLNRLSDNSRHHRPGRPRIRCLDQLQDTPSTHYMEECYSPWSPWWGDATVLAGYATLMMIDIIQLYSPGDAHLYLHLAYGSLVLHKISLNGIYRPHLCDHHTNRHRSSFVKSCIGIAHI